MENPEPIVTEQAGAKTSPEIGQQEIDNRFEGWRQYFLKNGYLSDEGEIKFLSDIRQKFSDLTDAHLEQIMSKQREIFEQQPTEEIQGSKPDIQDSRPKTRDVKDVAEAPPEQESSETDIDKLREELVADGRLDAQGRWMSVIKGMSRQERKHILDKQKAAFNQQFTETKEIGADTRPLFVAEETRVTEKIVKPEVAAGAKTESVFADVEQELALEAQSEKEKSEEGEFVEGEWYNLNVKGQPVEVRYIGFDHDYKTLKFITKAGMQMNKNYSFSRLLQETANGDEVYALRLKKEEATNMLKEKSSKAA